MSEHAYEGVSASCHVCGGASASDHAYEGVSASCHVCGGASVSGHVVEEVCASGHAFEERVRVAFRVEV